MTEILSEEERAKRAAANAAEAAETQRLAAQQRAIDIENGYARPIEHILADGIKGKLEREEFEQPQK